MAYIKNIKIENYRALKKIDFDIGRMAVLIGENDVGKTSVLGAIKTFFDNKKLTDRNDYHQHHTDDDIKVCIAFDYGDRQTTVRRTFPFGKPPTTEFFEEGQFRVASKDELPSAAPSNTFFFFPVNRDISIQYSMNKTALLGKLIRERVKMRIAKADAQESLNTLVKHTKEAIEEPRGRIENILREQMHNSSFSLLFQDLEVDPVDGVSFKPELSDDKVPPVPLSNRGAGTQNNLVIALLRYLAEQETGDNLIIALEEPENSLHPKAQRQLLSVLTQLATKHQVIVTTHSPVFIERTQYESNVLITRKSDGQSTAKIFSGEMLDDIRTELGIKPSDALLKGGGNCALIVEGDTEEEAIPDCFEVCGESEFGLGISIINAGGSDFEKIRRICSLLNGFSIPAIVMLDDDAKDTATELNRAKPLSLPNIEEVCVLSKGAIEDYFSKSSIRYVLNTEFGAQPEVTDKDLPDDLYGKDLLNSISRLLHERKCGKGLPFFKKTLGMHGIKHMRGEGLDIDDEIKAVVGKVADVAKRT